MSVALRLRRMGGNKDVFYRVVATDKRSPRDGRFLEVVGWYDPKKTGRNFKLKMDRIEHWISKGAEVSVTVKSLIRRNGREPEPVEAGEKSAVEVPSRKKTTKSEKPVVETATA
jgi:small subunit ribosomal protein S16